MTWTWTWDLFDFIDSIQLNWTKLNWIELNLFQFIDGIKSHDKFSNTRNEKFKCETWNVKHFKWNAIKRNDVKWKCCQNVKCFIPQHIFHSLDFILFNFVHWFIQINSVSVQLIFFILTNLTSLYPYPLWLTWSSDHNDDREWVKQGLLNKML